MTSPNAPKDSRIELLFQLGASEEYLYGVSTVSVSGMDPNTRYFRADPESAMELSEFYDDVTHHIREVARGLCESVFDLCSFQPSLFS